MKLININLLLILLSNLGFIKAIKKPWEDNPLFSKYWNENLECVTNISEFNDGFGSQYQNIIATAIYAELTNKKFVYSPFQNMEHNYDADPMFLEKKEWLINFKNNFEINLEKNATLVDECKYFFDNNIKLAASSQVLKKIKKIFKENKDLDNFFDNNYFNISIHVRRPNSDDNRIYGTDVPIEIYINIINNLRKIYFDKNLLFHIYSQGHEMNFTEFNSLDTVLHLNESVEDTFIGMVAAKVLVVAPSSFSWVAGIISDGEVYYIPFWHTPLPHWICAIG